MTRLMGRGRWLISSRSISRRYSCHFAAIERSVAVFADYVLDLVGGRDSIDLVPGVGRGGRA